MLIGLVDDRGKCIDWEDIEKGKGQFSDPIPLLLAIYPDRVPYCDFSVTELMDDPYYAQMKRRYDYYERPGDMLDRIMGTAFHALIEMVSEKAGIKTETRLIATYKYKGKNYKIGGTVDLPDDGKGTMWDYKTITIGKLRYMSSGRAASSLVDYACQLNLYRLLLHKNKKKVPSKLKIRAIVRDFRHFEYRRSGHDDKAYPRGCIIPVDMWELKDAESYLKKRLRLHVDAARLSDEKLHLAGECDTWNDHLRCNDFCPLMDICHFRRADEKKQVATKKKKTTKGRKKKTS